MKKTSQFVNNIKQKRPLWGTQEQLEIETENYSQSSENSENNKSF